jgi:hypothetical protein
MHYIYIIQCNPLSLSISFNAPLLFNINKGAVGYRSRRWVVEGGGGGGPTLISVMSAVPCSSRIVWRTCCLLSPILCILLYFSSVTSDTFVLFLVADIMHTPLLLVRHFRHVCLAFPPALRPSLPQSHARSH